MAKGPRNPGIREYLTALRDRTQPADVGLTRVPGGRRAAGVTQAQVAEHALGVDLRRYRRLESGDVRLAEYQVEQLAAWYGLDERARAELYARALGRPPAVASDPVIPAKLPSYWLHIIESIQAQEVPEQAGVRIGPIAYATNLYWDVLAGNHAFGVLFDEGVPPANVFKWMVHDGRAQLPGHEEYWLSRLLPQLDHLLLIYQKNPDELRRLRRLKAWADARVKPLEHPPSYQHPDGDVRPLAHARYGYGSLHIAAAEPMGAPGCRLVIMFFYPGQSPEDLLGQLQNGGATQ